MDKPPKPTIPIHRALICAFMVLPWTVAVAVGYLVGILVAGFSRGYAIGKVDGE